MPVLHDQFKQAAARCKRVADKAGADVKATVATDQQLLTSVLGKRPRSLDLEVHKALFGRE